jgi:hypothetical protein
MKNMESKTIKILGWYGMITGLLGDLIVTSHISDHWTWMAMWVWLTSNIAWGIYGFKTRAWHLVTLQASYFILSIWGIIRW